MTLNFNYYHIILEVKKGNKTDKIYGSCGLGAKVNVIFTILRK